MNLMNFVIYVLKVVESSVICDICNSSLHMIVVRLFDRRDIQPTNQPMASFGFIAHVWTILNKMASFGVNIYRPSASEHGQNITNIIMI